MQTIPNTIQVQPWTASNGKDEWANAALDIAQAEDGTITVQFTYLNPGGLYIFQPQPDGTFRVDNRGTLGFNNIGYTGYGEARNNSKHPKAFHDYATVRFEELQDIFSDLTRACKDDLSYRGRMSGTMVRFYDTPSVTLKNPWAPAEVSAITKHRKRYQINGMRMLHDDEVQAREEVDNGAIIDASCLVYDRSIYKDADLQPWEIEVENWLSKQVTLWNTAHPDDIITLDDVLVEFSW